MAQQPRDYGKEAVDRHRETRGKVSIAPKMSVETMEDLSIAYTPGVAAVSMAIANDKSESYNLTNRANMVADVLPAGPPPMTTTSHDCSAVVI